MNKKKVKKGKKAQTAIEFILQVIVVLFLFTVFFVAIHGNMADEIRERKNLVVKEIASIIQDEINLASQSSDGYYREFEIPLDITGEDYDVEIVENMAYVKTQDNKYAVALPVLTITGSIVKGQNTIKKENGEIKLNP